MFVLKCIGLALLVMLFLLLVLGMWIIFSRVRVEIRAKSGEAIALHFGIAPLHIRILPRQEKEGKKAEKPAKAKKPPKPQKPRKAKKPAKVRAKPNWKAIDYGALLSLALDLLGQLKDTLVLEVLLLRAIIATDDAAKTGMLAGISSAVAGIMVPFLQQNFRTEQLHITLDVDFEEEKTAWAVVVALAVRPASVLRVFWHNRKALYALYKQVMTKEEELSNG